MRLLDEIKNMGQDFEWYPTTQEIVNRIARDIDKAAGSHYVHTHCSILDIGTGDGGFFRKLDAALKDADSMLRVQRYGIEKATKLIEAWDDNITLLGTDFWQQTLIDKRVDMIFCNPPYSEFAEFMSRIIKEADAKYLYFVVPTRWKTNDDIKYAVKYRTNCSVEILGTYTFEHAERQARAVVDVVRIRINSKANAFDMWFDSAFNFGTKEETVYAFENKQKENCGQIERKLDTVEQLVNYYNADLQRILDSYRALESLDHKLMLEINVDVARVKECLQIRLRNLKSVYWKQLFERFNIIRERLTSNERRAFINRMVEAHNIDFTKLNIYTIATQCIKDGAKRIDDQVITFFKDLFDVDNIHLYKSNKRYNDDNWRYMAKDLTHYTLDYRIVYKSAAFRLNYSDVWVMTERGFDFLNDLCIIAHNVGFEVDMQTQLPETYRNEVLKDWRSRDIFTTKGEVLVNVKAYQNGNLHLKFNKEFMRKLNCEAGRLLGWLKSEHEAKENVGAKEGDWCCNFTCSNTMKALM